MNRPVGITVVAILMCLGGALLALGSVMFFVLGKTAVTFGNEGPMSALFAGMGAVGGVIFLALAVIYAVLAVSLWRLRAWARPASVAFIGIGQMFALLGILRSMPHPSSGALTWQIFVVVVDLAILWYLTTAHIVKVFSDQAARKPDMGALVKLAR